MMGLGYLGNGVSSSSSSSSSSNLSPLAPPFTVDRSTSKPNLNHSQYPPLPLPFTSSSWHNSSSSRLDFFPNRDLGVDSIRTTHLASVSDLCYESTSNHPWSHQNPSPGEPKPYHSPYISPVPVIDDDAPPIQPSYDLLTTSGFLTMDERLDYTQSLSGIEYTPQWGGSGLWNGEGKRMEVDGASLPYKSYTNQGGGCEVDSTVTQGNHVDVFGRENHDGSLSRGQLQDKSFVGQNRMSIPVESSILRSGLVLSESLMEPWNHQKSYNGPYEKQFKLFDSCMNDFAKSSPTGQLSIRPPAVGISAPLRTISSRAGDDISSKTKEEISNNFLTKNDHSSSSKARSGFNVSDINVMDGFLLKVESSDAVAANSSDSLDSPCWKGAPAAASAHTSLFEAVNGQQQQQQQHLYTKKLEESPSSSSPSHNLSSREGGIHLFPPYNDSLKSQQVFGTSFQNETTCLHDNNSGSSIPPEISNFPTKEHRSKSTDHAPKNNSSSSSSSTKAIQSINKNVKAHESKNDSNSKQQCGVEVDSLSSQRIKLKSDAGFAHEKAIGRESSPEMDVHMLVNAMHNLSELLLFRCSHDDDDDGCALDKKDMEALKQITDNLGACSSIYTNKKKKKTVHTTPSKHQPTTFPEGTSPPQHDMVGGSADHFIADEAERNKDDVLSGKKFQKKYAQLFTALRDDGDAGIVAKDYHVIQDIKKVLDEDFECEEELESNAGLFKNLWLEAEAELCISNYRTRFDRFRKTSEMERCNKLGLGRAKDGVLQKDMYVAEKASNFDGLETWKASDHPTTLLEPKSSHEKSNSTPRASLEAAAKNSLVAPLFHSCASAAASSTSLNNSAHFDKDDVEASVMARFHILKRRTISEEEKLPDDWPEVAIGITQHVAVGPSHLKDDGSSRGAGKKGGGGDELGGYNDDDDESEKELNVCGSGTDDPVGVVQQPYYTWNNKLSSSAAWYNSSLDWEHVLKDDFAFHNTISSPPQPI